ncbi:MAG: polysaccharide lyase [Cyanophyceae cyanobacterium]
MMEKSKLLPVYFNKTLLKFVALLTLGLIATTITTSIVPHRDKLKHQINDSFKFGSLLFSEDFEANNIAGWARDLCCRHSLRLESSLVRSGEQAAKVTLYRQDPLVENSVRSEIKRYGLFGMGTERWYGFSIFLPADYIADDSLEIVTQWHSVPDFYRQETWRTPPLALITANGNWSIYRRWDSNKVTQGGLFQPGVSTGDTESIDLGAYERGVWTDWVFYVKWSHESDGLLKVWKNGNLVVNRTGPNTFHDLIGPYFKIGIYKPSWKDDSTTSSINKRTLYIDEIRIGNAKAEYQDVAPQHNVKTN